MHGAGDTDTLVAMAKPNYASMTIFIDKHPDPALGYVMSSLIYKHEDDDEPVDSGPSQEADTLAEAKRVATWYAKRLRQDGVRVEILVNGNDVGLGAARKRRAPVAPPTHLIAAFDRFVADHGANWRMALNTAWMYGRYSDDVRRRGDDSLLQQLRSNYFDWVAAQVAAAQGHGLGAAHGKFHLYAEDGFESVHQTFAAAHQAAVRGAKRRGVTYYVVRSDAHGMTGGGKGTLVATVDGPRGGLGGGLGGRRHVYDYTTGNVLPGRVSAELTRASRQVPHTGVVAAYRDERGIWQYVPDQDVEHFRKNLRLDVQNVYVDED